MWLKITTHNTPYQQSGTHCCCYLSSCSGCVVCVVHSTDLQKNCSLGYNAPKIPSGNYKLYVAMLQVEGNIESLPKPKICNNSLPIWLFAKINVPMCAIVHFWMIRWKNFELFCLISCEKRNSKDFFGITQFGTPSFGRAHNDEPRAKGFANITNTLET